MAKFIKKQDGSLLNIVSLQNIKIDPEDNKNLILYRINGQMVVEKYSSTSDASNAYNTYKTAMTDTEGAGEKELKERIAELSAQVVEQQETISALQSENAGLSNTIDEALDISDDILGNNTSIIEYNSTGDNPFVLNSETGYYETTGTGDNILTATFTLSSAKDIILQYKGIRLMGSSSSAQVFLDNTELNYLDNSPNYIDYTISIDTPGVHTVKVEILSDDSRTFMSTKIII